LRSGGYAEELGHFLMQETKARFIGLNPFAIEDELRDGALAGLGDHFIRGAGGSFDIDLGVRDVVLGEETLRLAAVAAPVSGIHEKLHRDIVADSQAGCTFAGAVNAYDRQICISRADIKIQPTRIFVPKTAVKPKHSRSNPVTMPSAGVRRTMLLWLGGAALVLVVIVLGCLPLINKYWPYRYRNVKPLLESVLASKIKIDKYHRTYFPRPGFVASGLTLTRNTAPDLPPVGTAKDLIVQGSWLDMLMLRRRVQLVDVVGLHIVIPPVGSRANQADFPAGSSADFAGPTTAVGTFHVRDAQLDIQRVNGGTYSFPIKDLVIRNLQKGRTITYSVDMQNAQPTGRIQSKGNFGPLKPENLGATPLSGQFTFAPVNLGDIGGIHGTLSATGKFSGTLAAVEAEADSDTPDFAVGKGKPTQVVGHVQSTVNGLNGNVVLHTVDVKTGATGIHVEGSIVGATGTPKVTDLDITIGQGHAEDLLRPFFAAKVPITGAVTLRSHARLDGGHAGASFFDRLHMSGGFNVPAERLTNEKSEKNLSSLSQRAQGIKQSGEDASADTDVLSSLNGDVTVRGGVASTPRLTFAIPGATANLNGTFDLKSSKVNLVGTLTMDTDITHVTTGFKSVLLKPLIPFTKKKKAGAVIPIAVTGSPGTYKVGQDFLGLK